MDHFDRVPAGRHEVPMRRFGAGAMAALRSLRWPGNVRELRNLIERLLLTGSSEVVTLDDLPCAIASPATIPQQADAEPSGLDEAERDAIQLALRNEDGNLAAAARRLGVSRSTIYREICRYRLEVAEAPKHELAGWIERRAH